MPICEADPWRLQYFEVVACPPGVNIATEDSDAWLWYPKHRWVYDKIAVARSQGLEAAPHGVSVPRFPVFSKPITNLRGMGIASRVLNSQSEYEQSLTPGHMWMELLEGRHVSSDVAVVDGEPRWWRHVTGKPSGEGTFDHWTVHCARDQAIEEYCGDWIRSHLAGYTGILNTETIGGRMIEVHLRMSDQWPDLYGAGWVDAVVRLYHRGIWEFADRDRRDGYSVVLFGPHGPCYRHPPPALVTQIRNMAGCPACRSPFTRTGRPSSMRCRPAASASPSSMPGACKPASPAAPSCNAISSARRVGRNRRPWRCRMLRDAGDLPDPTGRVGWAKSPAVALPERHGPACDFAHASKARRASTRGISRGRPAARRARDLRLPAQGLLQPRAGAAACRRWRRPGLKLREAPSFERFPIYNADVAERSPAFRPRSPPGPMPSAAPTRLIIVSPEYNWSIPGGLKNAIDWASRLKEQPFKDKPVVLQSCAPGLLGGSRMQYHLRQCADHARRGAVRAGPR